MRLFLTEKEAAVAYRFEVAGYAMGVSGKLGIGEPSSEAEPDRIGSDVWLWYLNRNPVPYYYVGFQGCTGRM